MAKAKKNNTSAPVALTLSGYEQSTLRILLALRETANASVAAASGTVRNYLIQLLQGRNLDPQKWGVSPDMTTFVEIKQPEAVPAPAPGGPQVVAQSTPLPAAAPAQS